MICIDVVAFSDRLTELTHRSEVGWSVMLAWDTYLYSLYLQLQQLYAMYHNDY